MPGDDPVYRFIFDHIDSVPHLEALLLLWCNRPRLWPAEEIAARIFVEVDRAKLVLTDLGRNGLAERLDGGFAYAATDENDRMLAMLEQAYRTNLIGISTMIHSKASPGVREFARAFQFSKKEKKP